MAEVSDAPRALLEMRDIAKRFGATVALDRVDLTVAPGEICGLVGENGAGKSTLMAILAGATQPDQGSMAIDGRPYAPRSPIAARRAGVAMIHQELSLAPHLSVMENILLGVEPTRYGFLRRREMAAIATRALAELGHGDLSPDTLVGTLTMPVQQIVEIARAIAVGCRVLVLDEPTSSLGREDARQLFAMLGRLRSQGHAIVYISHFLEEVTEIADRFVVLRDGRNAGEGPTAGATHDAIVAMMIGGSARAIVPAQPTGGEGADPDGGCTRAGRRHLHAASRRSVRDRRADRRRTHAPVANALRPRAGPPGNDHARCP